MAEVTVMDDDSSCLSAPADARIVAPPSDADRRVRRYALAEHDVLDLFARMGEGLPRCVRVPKLDIPAGATVVPGVFHDWYSRTFQFIVKHPSFPSVPDGEVTPRDEMAVYEVVRLAVRGSADIDALVADLVERWTTWEAEADRESRNDPDGASYHLRLRVAEYLRDSLGG